MSTTKVDENHCGYLVPYTMAILYIWSIAEATIFAEKTETGIFP